MQNLLNFVQKAVQTKSFSDAEGDLARLIEGSKEVRTSEFATAMIGNM